MIELDELVVLLRQLSLCYQSARPIDAEGIAMWRELLDDMTADEFRYAAREYAKESDSAFPPTPSQLWTFVKQKRRSEFRSSKQMARIQKEISRTRDLDNASGDFLSKRERQEQAKALRAEFPDLFSNLTMEDLIDG